MILCIFLKVVDILLQVCWQINANVIGMESVFYGFETLKYNIMIYDYYYSAAHEAHIKAMYEVTGERYRDTYINGMKYTEMTATGEKPVTGHFGDIKKIHTGTDKGIIVR